MGAWLLRFAVDARFSVGNVMARNQLIYALADRTIVVASAEGKGGTWAGAIEALAHGWNVAVQHSEPMSAGNAALAVRGAAVVDDARRTCGDTETRAGWVCGRSLVARARSRSSGS